MTITFTHENEPTFTGDKTNFHMKGFALGLALKQGKDNSEMGF